MKKSLLVLCLCSAFGLAACGTSSSSSSASESAVNQQAEIDFSKAGPDAKKYQITFEQVADAVRNGAKFYDVRASEEFAAGNFGITENLPISDLMAGKLPDLAKDTPIYVHCLKGIRSAQAVKILREAGFTQVFDLGGIEHVKAIGGVIQ